ncbi:MAG: IS21-like element helper ATPase IstB [Halieaceae bacterium]|jgi:DNA replication protein DnaC|nr:IS21-like element helper ATPase IstB [Halieaceae bacterium]
MSTTMKTPTTTALAEQLADLKLAFMLEQHGALAGEAARAQWDHLAYLAALVEGEAALRRERSVQRRIKLARFPVIKTLEQFQWSWPKAINRTQVQHLFRLDWVAEQGNVVFLGTVGVGKTHLATALGYAACLKGLSVRFATAIEVVNTLVAAERAGRLKQALESYRKPSVLVLDELGYLPIDKTGADLLFQILSQRYEQSATVITSNRAYKDWAEIFNHDATLTSALLDRLLHHAETVLIEGQSYRMKDRVEV